MTVDIDDNKELITIQFGSLDVIGNNHKLLTLTESKADELSIKLAQALQDLDLRKRYV